MTHNSLRMQIVAEAKSWLGTPYIHQASCKHFGADCLGLIRGVWRTCIGEEPEQIFPYSPDIGEFGSDEPIIHTAQRYFSPNGMRGSAPGDLLIFRWRRQSPAKHLGIMVNQNHFIHAYERAGVVEAPLQGFWFSKLVRVFSFPGANA